MSERGKALSRARRQVLLVRTLKDRLREMDGAGADTAYIEDKLRKETRILIAYEAKARAHLDGLTPQLYAFAVMYFIAGESLENTAEAIDRSVRQCGRYKRALLREEDEGGMSGMAGGFLKGSMQDGGTKTSEANRGRPRKHGKEPACNT